jgi:hypothetical protein
LIIPGLLLWFLLSGADGHMWQVGILPVRPALLKAGVLLPVFAFMLSVQLLKDRGKRLVSLYRANAPLLIATFSFALVQTVWAFHPGAYWGDGGYLAFRQFALFIVVLLTLPLVLVPGVVENYRSITLGALCLLLVTMLSDLLNPGTYSSTGLGAAGWAENPNYAAGAVIALAILAVNWSRYSRIDWLLWGVVGGLVVISGSRSGLIMWGLSVVFWNRHHFPGLYRLGHAVIGFAVFAVVMAFIIRHSAGKESVAAYLAAKFMSFTDWELLTQGERLSLASRYLDLIGQRPLLGHGAWFWVRDEIGAHNVFLMLWASNGILGLISYVFFILLILYNSLRLADKRTFVLVLIIFLIQGFFSHMLVIREPFFVALALGAGLAWTNKVGQRLAE